MKKEKPDPIVMDLWRPGTIVRVYQHVVPAPTPVACVSYVSDGLRMLGQPEVVFTMRWKGDAGVAGAPQAPLDAFRVIIDYSDRGLRLGAGAFVGRAFTRFVSLPGVSGFAFEPAWPMDDVDLPRGCLAMIALVGDELAVADASGPQRILARLALATRFYPTAPWFDPARQPLGAADEPSILGRLGTTIHLPGITATADPGWVALRIARATRAPLAAYLETSAERFALLTSPDVRADGRLAWSPGQARTEALTPPGSLGKQLAGCFAAYEPDAVEDGAVIVEDGFVIRLRSASAARLRAAMIAGDALELPATKPRARGLRLEWTGELA